MKTKMNVRVKLKTKSNKNVIETEKKLHNE